MSIRGVIRGSLKAFGYELYNKNSPNIWSEDGLSTHHNFKFSEDPLFQRAYAKGVAANGGDHHIRWRAHVAFWVARQVHTLPGDFVECGVSTGFLSAGIMDLLNWNELGKKFYFFDTWEGLDARFLSEAEMRTDRLNWYADANFDKVVSNFKKYNNVTFVKGAVPETLSSVQIDKLCYLSLDMNCTAPEISAAEYFWDKLVPGGMMLLDDYCYSGYEEQHDAFDDFARRVGAHILSLPTGQGIIQKSFAR